MKKNNPAARKRILKAAVKVFSEKSFAGSRVDEIAREAEVTKSLIYYHFKSKDEILDVLTEGFLSEYKEVIHNGADDSHQSKAADLEAGRKTAYTNFIKRNSDLMRIIFIESLIHAHSKPLIFKIVEEMIAIEVASLNQGEQKGYNRAERLVAEFFTNIIPCAAYLCFKDAWSGYFDIETAELDRLFGKVFSETHEAYHKKHD